MLVWGKAEEEAFKTVCSELDDSKVHVFGNPKLDFVRYLPKSIFPKEKPNSVGFVSRFPRINHHEGIPTIRNLWERHTCNFTITMTRAYTSFYEVARAVLENTDLDVSVRVHPFEDIGAYYKYFIPALPKEHQHRVSIDDS